MKLIVQPARSTPVPFHKPDTPRLARQWERALKVACPACDMPPQQRCINLAPSHAAAGVARETKAPHPERLS